MQLIFLLIRRGNNVEREETKKHLITKLKSSKFHLILLLFGGGNNVNRE